MEIAPEEVNAEFRKHGWTIIKALEALDGDYLSEDLAQFQKGSLVVDFGFFGDGTNTATGCFKVFLIEGEDWENSLATFNCTQPEIAFHFLLSFAGY